MNRDSAEPSKAEAQLLMSRLLDGELGPADAARLEAYLERRPDEADWMESLDLVRQAQEARAPAPDARAAAEAVAAAIARETEIKFPAAAARRSPLAFVGGMAAAAALAIAGGLAWLAFGPGGDAGSRELYASKGSVVEFVSTDIPDASTFVYTDDASGWTVVWVEAIGNAPDNRG